MGQNSSVTRYLSRIGDHMRGNRNVTFADNEDKRIITINSGPQPTKFISNRISTSKYSLITFLPKFLFEQFRKYSNIFFLCIVIFQVGRKHIIEANCLFWKTILANPWCIADRKIHNSCTIKHYTLLRRNQRNYWGCG